MRFFIVFGSNIFDVTGY